MFANFNQNTAAAHVVVANQDNPIRLTSLALVAAGAVSVTIENTAGDNLIGPVPLAANSQFVLPHNPDGWCKSETGLNILLSGGVQVGGVVNYSTANKV